jgi:hypothetical protein
LRVQIKWEQVTDHWLWEVIGNLGKIEFNELLESSAWCEQFEEIWE